MAQLSIVDAWVEPGQAQAALAAARSLWPAAACRFREPAAWDRVAGAPMALVAESYPEIAEAYDTGLLIPEGDPATDWGPKGLNVRAADRALVDELLAAGDEVAGRLWTVVSVPLLGAVLEQTEDIETQKAIRGRIAILGR